jgi:hypothetical protein
MNYGASAGNLYGYDNGKYCAEIEYYNYKTERHSSYELTVEVADNELIRIDWPNGGWLDESHFTPEKLDEDGTVNFLSDKGYQYTVTIKSTTPCSYNGPPAPVAGDESESESD